MNKFYILAFIFSYVSSMIQKSKKENVLKKTILD